MLFNPNLSWKTTRSTVSILKKVRGHHITTTCAFFVLLLFSCTEIRNWKKKHQRFSVRSSIEWMDSTLLSFKESIWTIFHLMRTFCTWAFFYGIDIVDGKVIGELAGWNVQKYGNTVGLLRYNNHICYMSNISGVFESFFCSNCDTFFNRTSNLKQDLTSCKDLVEHVYPRNVYQIREALFDKLNSFGIEYTKEQALFKNLAVFDF